MGSAERGSSRVSSTSVRLHSSPLCVDATEGMAIRESRWTEPSVLFLVARYGTVLGVPASYLALAGSVNVVPVVGSTQGQVFAPKKAGLPVR